MSRGWRPPRSCHDLGIVSRPALFERLRDAARVTEVSAPPGSGKTVLLRSWITQAGLADRAGWVLVQGEERDSQRFWISVADALRSTAAGRTCGSARRRRGRCWRQPG